MTILAWVAHIQKFLIASHILRDNRVNTTSTYVVTNVAQYWDIMGEELQSSVYDPLDWQHFIKALIHSYGSVNLEMVAHCKLCLLSQKGSLEEYTTGFQDLCSNITKFPISTSDKVERFLVGLKEVRNKILVDPKGDGDPQEDSKHIIHYPVTIDATYT